MTYDFDLVCQQLLDYCKELGRIPKKNEIKEHPLLPSDSGLRYLFKTRMNITYNDYCESFGYKNSKQNFYNIDMLKDSWENFYERYNKYPKERDYSNKEFNIPSYKKVIKILGENKDGFFAYYKQKEDQYIHDEFLRVCNEFKDFCINNKIVLGMRELTKNGFPSSSWFINHSSDNINSYAEFLGSIGLKPKGNIPKDIAAKLILQQIDKLNRHIVYDDFRNPSFNEIGIRTITRLWGTFNEMLKDLGLSINQEDMVSKHRGINELQRDIDELCEYIFKTEGRRNISLEDINNCDWCLDSGTYNRYFKENLGMTIGEYIKSIGFIPNKIGMGMVYEFDDGEITTSQFEFNVSNYLRDNKITYDRNIKYRTFIDDYEGNKDCDYVISHNNKTWYIEIAGMLDYSKVNINKNDFIRAKYKKDLNNKINMLNKSHLNYRIIYPDELRLKSLDEVFSFLGKEERKKNAFKRYHVQ